MSTEEKEERAKQQARAQLESIVEMVAALDREKAAALYVRDMERAKLEELATAGGRLTFYEDETIADVTDEDLREEVAELLADELVDDDGFEFDEDTARQTIQEDALSVEVRSGWHTPGEESEPTEFMILLCTGGPAVRIVGDLGRYNSPENPRLQYQDWFTGWSDYTGTTSDEEEALQTYCEQFYFGE